MYDPAILLMEFYYLYMCLEWGNWKANEYSYLTDKEDPSERHFLFLLHTILAPFTALRDLYLRVK